MAKYLTIESIKSCLQRAKTYFDNKLKLKADLTSLQSTNSNVSSLTTQLSAANSKITASEKAIATNTTNISKNQDSIKDLLGTKADKTELDSYVNTYAKSDADANELLSPGFYRLQNITNVPTGSVPNYHKWGNIVIVRKEEYDTIAQIYFSSRNTTLTDCFAARWGGVASDSYDFRKGPWLYFHGSTSPNIPVLKKKVIRGETSALGNIAISGITTTSCIVLSAHSLFDVEDYSVIGIPFNFNDGRLFFHVIRYDTNATVSKKEVGFCVFYLEVPSGYNIPEYADTAASDEPEDDEGLAPQSYTTYEKPSETKQFHGESLYE